MYETEYGIKNHMHSTNPLGSVSFNKAENYLKDYLYDSYLTLFIEKKIGSSVNISFDEFINRPRYELESIVNIVMEIDKIKSEVMKKQLDSVDSKFSENLDDIE
jgi:hypothetical protein